MRQGVFMQNEGKRLGSISAILLILSFLLPLARLALVAQTNKEAFLPACCKARGKHHCSMQMLRGTEQGGASSSSSSQFLQLSEKCPCTPGLPPSTHERPLWHGVGLLCRTCWQIDRSLVLFDHDRHALAAEGSNHKRGPPVLSYIA